MSNLFRFGLHVAAVVAVVGSASLARAPLAGLHQFCAVCESEARRAECLEQLYTAYWERQAVKRETVRALAERRLTPREAVRRFQEVYAFESEAMRIMARMAFQAEAAEELACRRLLGYLAYEPEPQAEHGPAVVARLRAELVQFLEEELLARPRS